MATRFTFRQRLLVFSLLFSLQLHAGKIEKGFAELNKKNYFYSETYFRKSLKKNRSIAAFGLTKLFLTADYKNLDSAYRYVQVSEITFSVLKPNQIKKYSAFGFDSTGIAQLKQEVSNGLFERANKYASEENFIQFIKANPWSTKIPDAIILRDSLAYQKAEKSATSEAFQVFMDKYPDSYLKVYALQRFKDLQYQEYLQIGSIDALVEFLKKCPENPHQFEAQDKIYEWSTKSGKEDAFYAFIKRFPENQNVDDAWRSLYKICVKEYTFDQISAFKTKYPDYPFQGEITEDLDLYHAAYYPVSNGELWGYMNNEGKIAIQPEYDQVGPFSDGVAIVVKNGKSGIINKKNQVLVPFNFDEILDFIDGRAIASIGDSSTFIDRSGKLLSELKYTDMLALGDDLFAVKAKGKSNYSIVDANFNEKKEAIFEEVNVFVKGLSIVKCITGYGVLNKQCNWVIYPEFQSLRFLSDSLVEYGLNGKKGLMRMSGKRLTEPVFDEISKWNKSNLQMIAKMGSFIFYLNELGMKVLTPAYEYFPNAFEKAAFYNGVAVFRKKGKFGLMDFAGKEILKPTFENLGRPFTGIPVQKMGKWGIMDTKGIALVSLDYDNIETLPGEGYQVEKAGLVGIMNEQFQEVIPCAYQIIKPFENDYYLVSDGQKYGLFTKKGQPVLGMEFDLIQVFEADCLSLVSNSETSYYFLRSNSVLRQQR